MSHIREARKLSCCIRSVKRILWRCMVALYLNLRNLYRKYAGAFTPVFDMVFQNSFRSSSYLAKPQLSQSKVCFSIHLCKQYLCFQICLCDRVWRCVWLCVPVVCVCACRVCEYKCRVYVCMCTRGRKWGEMEGKECLPLWPFGVKLQFIFCLFKKGFLFISFLHI